MILRCFEYFGPPSGGPRWSERTIALTLQRPADRWRRAWSRSKWWVGPAHAPILADGVEVAGPSVWDQQSPFATPGIVVSAAELAAAFPALAELIEEARRN